MFNGIRTIGELGIPVEPDLAGCGARNKLEPLRPCIAPSAGLLVAVLFLPAHDSPAVTIIVNWKAELDENQ